VTRSNQPQVTGDAMSSGTAQAAGHSVDPAGWQQVLDRVLEPFAGRFTRVEPRRTAAGFVAGLLSEVEVKTAGIWPNGPGTPGRTRRSGCCTGPGRTPTPFASRTPGLHKVGGTVCSAAR
jgi:hypothetical protein